MSETTVPTCSMCRRERTIGADELRKLIDEFEETR